AAFCLRDRVTAAIPINSSTPLHDPAARRVTPLVIQGSYALMRYAPRIGLRWAIRNMRKAEGPLRASIREALRQPDSPYLAQELALASHRWDFDHTAIAQADIATPACGRSSCRQGGCTSLPVDMATSPRRKQPSASSQRWRQPAPS